MMSLTQHIAVLLTVAAVTVNAQQGSFSLFSLHSIIMLPPKQDWA